MYTQKKRHMVTPMHIGWSVVPAIGFAYWAMQTNVSAKLRAFKLEHVRLALHHLQLHCMRTPNMHCNSTP